MTTKKITLNELRTLVKQIIKEENNPYNGYINNIYGQQSEYPAREQFYSFARENGFHSSIVDKALDIYKYDTEKNAWGEQYNTKKAGEGIINYIVDKG
jgi:hypothetical protein